MARRRAGHFRRAPQRGPSAFASTQLAGGKSLTWESLVAATTPVAINNFATNSGPGGATQRIRTILPVNVLRGAVTLERIRGYIAIWFSDADSVAAVDWFVDVSLQLFPARGGNIDLNSMLSSTDAADLESNRFVWRKTYLAPQPLVAAATYQLGTVNTLYELDIKSRRRFDRSNWGLGLVFQASINSNTEHFVRADLRGLFRASDAL